MSNKAPSHDYAEDDLLSRFALSPEEEARFKAAIAEYEKQTAALMTNLERTRVTPADLKIIVGGPHCCR
jgi:hypothetical protein